MRSGAHRSPEFRWRWPRSSRFDGQETTAHHHTSRRGNVRLYPNGKSGSSFGGIDQLVDQQAMPDHSKQVAWAMAACFHSLIVAAFEHSLNCRSRPIRPSGREAIALIPPEHLGFVEEFLEGLAQQFGVGLHGCLLYTSPSPRDQRGSRMPSSA